MLIFFYYLGFSPQNTMSKSTERSPYENINGSMSLLKAPQSPRTQIRTMLPTVQHQELRENEQLMVSDTFSRRNFTLKTSLSQNKQIVKIGQNNN